MSLLMCVTQQMHQAAFYLTLCTVVVSLSSKLNCLVTTSLLWFLVSLIGLFLVYQIKCPQHTVPAQCQTADRCELNYLPLADVVADKAPFGENKKCIFLNLPLSVLNLALIQPDPLISVSHRLCSRMFTSIMCFFLRMCLNLQYVWTNRAWLHTTFVPYLCRGN